MISSAVQCTQAFPKVHQTDCIVYVQIIIMLAFNNHNPINSQNLQFHQRIPSQLRYINYHINRLSQYAIVKHGRVYDDTTVIKFSSRITVSRGKTILSMFTVQLPISHRNCLKLRDKKYPQKVFSVAHPNICPQGSLSHQAFNPRFNSHQGC